MTLYGCQKCARGGDDGNDNNNGKWFEPRSLSRLCGLIVRVRVVPRRTVVTNMTVTSDSMSAVVKKTTDPAN